MEFIQVVEFDPGDRAVWHKLGSKIVVANHPSILDVVMFIALIPNTDCIVGGQYLKNIILRGVIRRLYVVNSLDYRELEKACVTSLQEGSCLLIFPEGTRTRRTGAFHIKKGAARIAMVSGCPIVPAHIGGTDKWGLGKHDPWTAFNHTDKYVYRIRMQEEISPAKYAGLPPTIAVGRLNKEIRQVLLNPGII
jgi:1-acyl-sn-glycerol-3-phosphate acyltransferase